MMRRVPRPVSPASIGAPVAHVEVDHRFGLGHGDGQRRPLVGIDHQVS
jgi:hypothetical protein